MQFNPLRQEQQERVPPELAGSCHPPLGKGGTALDTKAAPAAVPVCPGPVFCQFRTPNSERHLTPSEHGKRKTIVPDGEKPGRGRAAFVTACQTCFLPLLFRRLCRIMPHEQEIFKHRYRETGKIAHSGRVWGNRICAFVCLAGRQGIFSCLFAAKDPRKSLLWIESSFTGEKL